jgi:hypothetical protein
MVCFPGQCQPIVDSNTLASVTYAYFPFYRGHGFHAERLGLAVPPGVRDRVIKLLSRRLFQAQPDHRPTHIPMIHKEFKSCF